MTLLSGNVRTLIFSLMLGLSAGCSNNIETGFEGDITKPIDGIPTNPVPTTGLGPYPTQYCYQTNGHYTSNIAISRGGDDKYDWALGGTCVTRPLREAWAAINNTSLMRWPEAEEYSAALNPPPSGVQIFWNTHYHLSRFPVGSIDWDMAWYHTILRGSPADPRQVLINYGKYKGTSFIKRWQGSVLLEFVTPSITSITIKDTLSATNQNSGNCENTIRALITNDQADAPNYDPINALPGQTVPVPTPSKIPSIESMIQPEV